MRNRSTSLIAAVVSALCLAGMAGCPPKKGPTAAFTAAPRSGPAPLAVQFTDASNPGDGAITSWSWTFGDGASSLAQHPAHTYPNPGSYDVGLTVTTQHGSDTRFETRYVVVSPSEGEGEGEGEFAGFLEVPDPLSGDNPRYALPAAAAPQPGAYVNDVAFGTRQRRVTQTEGMRHEYSRFDPFNADGSRILLTHLPTGDWRVYRTASVPYDTPANLVATLNIEEPRWDPQDPDLIWGNIAFRIIRVNVATGAETTVKDFAQDPTIGPLLAAQPDLYRITMRDEGESSIDKRYWAFAIQGSNDDYRIRYVFCWDRTPDQVLGLLPLSTGESIIDWVGMSALGNFVLIGGEWDNGGNLTGLTMANRHLTQFNRLDYSTAHADVGLDTNGNEVVVMQNVRTDYIDLIPIDWATQPILEAGGDYAGTNRVPLMRLFYDNSPIGFRGGVHISCNHPGYAVVSTETPLGEPEQNWLDRTVTLVYLDPAAPRVFYLAKVYGTTGAYWEETHGTIANDGSKIVWATNWNRNVGQERVWVQQLDMPANWEDSL